jgi:predicted Zn finger-like uncharacterized protein
VIVTCERCETEFQLDEARVPAGGARVRCSRCKHAFFVMPPAASSVEEEIDRAASRALDDDPTPDVTEDLPDVAAEAPQESTPSESAEDGESDWEFSADLPADAGDSSPDLFASRAADASAQEPSSDPLSDEEAEESLDLATEPAARPERASEPARRSESAPEPDADLGTPLNWDFFEKDSERPRPIAAVPLPPQRASAPALVVESAPEPVAARDPSRALRYVAEGAGWLATAGLCAIALLHGFAPAAPVATDWPDPAPGVALEQVGGHWLDNVSLGRLYVVSGRVHNVAADAASLPPLVLELRDASGHSLGRPIPLRGPSSAQALRTADAAALATVGSDRPGGLAAGVTWEFQAVAWPLPAEAARFAIRAGS